MNSLNGRALERLSDLLRLKALRFIAFPVDSILPTSSLGHGLKADKMDRIKAAAWRQVCAVRRWPQHRSIRPQAVSKSEIQPCGA